ncbi:MAG: hypothetical protein Q7J34_05885 [Bacteroidales bacterium]|jgi:antitoxin component YwqK of YwqJK toxin-antitoxin module|nr:hypothetical protein [Bacteroidales bacterium]
MYRIFGLLLVVFLMVSCVGKEVEVVKEKFDDGKPRLVGTFYVKGSDSTLMKEVAYYQTGQKYLEGSYQNEKRHGLWTAWFDNGEIWSKGSYHEGIEHGHKVLYHPSGARFYEGDYDMGKQVGMWRFFDKEDSLIKEIDYDQNPPKVIK